MNISDELERILNEMDSDEQKKAQESNVAKQMALLADGGTPTGVTKKTPTGANDLIKELKEQMYGADPVNTYMPTQQDFSTQLMQYLAQMFMPGLVQQGQYNVPTAAHGNYADVPSHASGGSIGYHQPGSLEQNMMALGGHRALPIIMALHKANGGRIDLPKFAGGGDLSVSEQLAQDAGVPQLAPITATVKRDESPWYEGLLGAADLGKTLVGGAVGMVPAALETGARVLGGSPMKAEDIYAQALSHYTPDLITQRGKEMGEDLSDALHREYESAKANPLQYGTDVLNRGMIAGLAGAPVDMTNEVLKLFGLGSEKPFGGSESIGSGMESMGIVSPERHIIGELGAGLVDPFSTAATGAKLAHGMTALMPLMTAYHGTPHKFEAFDASKIGTGEGAQAYGHGLYLAENPNVAKEYRDALSTYKTTLNGEPLAPSHPLFSEGMSIAANGYEKALKQAEDALKSGFVNPEYAQKQIDNIKSLKGAKIEQSKQGNLYKVDLPDEHIEKMLDWDKSWKQQPKNVQDAINIDNLLKYYKAEDLPTSQVLYHANQNMSPKDFAKFLSDKGVPGIKYLDEQSRATGEGTRNFVIFPGNEDKLKILSRNGVPVNPLEPEAGTLGSNLGNFYNLPTHEQTHEQFMKALEDKPLIASPKQPSVEQMQKELASKEDALRLYHGSPEENLSQVQDKGLFGGVFGSADKDVALSHGDHIYHSDIPESKILTNDDLNYQLPYKKVSKALINNLLSLARNKDLREKAWEAIVEDKGVYHLDEDDLQKIFGTSDLGEAGWEAQKVRGAIAKDLGYQAVEMKDEHGTSYLILPGAKLHKSSKEKANYD